MCLSPIFIKGRPVACGKCIECALDYSKQWAFRCALESTLYDKNCIATLTYNEDNCRSGSRLVKRDLQLFLKRLRKKLKDDKLRFFACGERGKKRGRWHVHIILFNFCPDDLEYFYTDEKGTRLYKSKFIADTWQNGFITVCPEVTVQSALYTAKYLQKLNQNGDDKAFLQMSRRPGIGANAIKVEWLTTDKVYVNGKYIKIPRFFLDKFKEVHFYDIRLEKIKIKRDNALKLYDYEVTSAFFANENGDYFNDFLLKRYRKMCNIFGKENVLKFNSKKLKKLFKNY